VLGRVRRRFDFDPSRKVWGYSKGNRQKINSIAALASRVGLLILDEQTADLDPLMEQAFRESMLEARGNGRRCSCRDPARRQAGRDRDARRAIRSGAAWGLVFGCTRTTTRGV